MPMLLPAWELCLYGLLTVGSHLYAFYEAHQVSRSKCATWARSLGHSFPSLAGEAVWYEFFSPLGFYFLPVRGAAVFFPAADLPYVRKQ